MKEPRELPTPSSRCECREKAGADNLLALDLGPPASRTIGNRCLLSRSYTLGYFVLVTLTNEYSMPTKNCSGTEKAQN